MSPKRMGMVIKRLREDRGLTQEALAKKAGISRVYLAQIEGSSKKPPVRTPTIPTLEKLAKALKVKLAELLK